MATPFDAVNSGVDRARQDNAYNALQRVYGDPAGNPQAAAVLQDSAQSAQAQPYLLRQKSALASQEESKSAQQQQITALSKQNAQQGALLNGAYAVQSAIDRAPADADKSLIAAQAFDQISPHLGLDPATLASTRADIAKDPSVVKTFIAGLQSRAKPGAQSQRFQVVYDESGNGFKVTANGLEPITEASGAQLRGAQPVQAQQRIQQNDQRIQLAQPAKQGEIAAAKATGKVAGTTTASLPDLEVNYNSALDRINEVRSLPGIKAIFGTPSLAKALQSGGLGAIPFQLPGSEAADASVKLQGLVSQLRSQAYEILKGGGSITEAESKFAADAFAALDRPQSLESFQGELKRLETFLGKKMGAARQRAALGAAPAPAAAAEGDQHVQPGNRIRLKWNPEKGIAE